MQSQKQFRFDNVEPSAYLRNFNSMAEYCDNALKKAHSLNKLSLMPLSKFPVPPCYSEMQGIYEAADVQSQNKTDRKKQVESELEDAFLKKHELFMKDQIQRLLSSNEGHHETLLKHRSQYKKPLRSNEMPSLRSTSRRTMASQKSLPPSKNALPFNNPQTVRSSEPAIVTPKRVQTLAQLQVGPHPSEIFPQDRPPFKFRVPLEPLVPYPECKPRNAVTFGPEQVKTSWGRQIVTDTIAFELTLHEKQHRLEQIAASKIRTFSDKVTKYLEQDRKKPLY